jgi:hypothetical protein
MFSFILLFKAEKSSPKDWREYLIMVLWNAEFSGRYPCFAADKPDLVADDWLNIFICY